MKSRIREKYAPIVGETYPFKARQIPKTFGYPNGLAIQKQRNVQQPQHVKSAKKNRSSMVTNKCWFWLSQLLRQTNGLALEFDKALF